jgi:hypothetical protein
MTAVTCNRRAGSATYPLVVVHATDTVNPTFAGCGDAPYGSPPQPRDEAINLVGLLLGRHGDLDGEETRWTGPVAGGQRSVTLRPALSLTALCEMEDRP